MARSTKRREKVDISTIDMTFPPASWWRLWTARNAWHACLMALSDAAPRLPIVTVDQADFAVYLRGRRSRRLVTPT
jgi:hypothetical protein